VEQILEKAAAPVARPEWCRYLPEDSTVSASDKTVCSTSSCICEDFCLAHVSSDAWRWIPQCCACTQAPAMMMPMAMAASGAPGTSTSSPQKDDEDSMPEAREVPAWCEHMPADWPGSACDPTRTTPPACDCNRYCGRNLPRDLWSQSPDCCGCGMLRPDHHDASSKTVEGNDEITTAPSQTPTWCRHVKWNQRSPLCAEGTCECKDFCHRGLVQSSWQNLPECCACIAQAPDEDTSETKGDGNASQASAPEEAAAAATTITP